ncbi:MAG: HAD family phosphatase [Clostridia bacterium]
MKVLRAVIFDMDGVLVNSEPLYHLSDKKMFDRLGIPFTHEDVKGLVGVNSTEGARGILARHPQLTLSVSQLDAIYKDSLFEALSTNDDLCLIAGVLDWIRRLKNDGFALAVASSSTAPMVAYIMERFGLNEYMGAVINGGMVEFAKPAPDIFLKAARAITAKPENCVVIEDSTNGIAAARAAGMKCLAYTGANVHGLDNSGADAHFDEYSNENYERFFR